MRTVPGQGLAAADVCPPGVVLSWAGISETCAAIAGQVTVDGLPDVIVCLIRGGMVPGVLLSHLLSCRDLRGLSLTHTCADGVNAAKTSSPVLSNPESAGDVRGRDVLLVDDVAGTGATALAAVTMITGGGAARTRIAVCAVNTRNWNPAVPDPGECLDYIGGHYRGWVVFPWERQ
jgi:hypoxanthine phosphoribosyltransferase